VIFLIIAFLSFLITIVSTPYLIAYLNKKDIVDRPNGEERRVHSEPIPRLGGIIIFAVTILISFAFYNDIYSKKYFLTGAFTIFELGIADDIKGINWYIKFIVQSIAAIFLILSLEAHNFTVITLVELTLPPGLNYLILFVLIVGLFNAFNLLDGLDGLVSGLSIAIASMCFLLSIDKPFSFLPVLSSAIAGTTLGFLKFNANPARIFLGDSGALTLSYFLAGMVLMISGEFSSSVAFNTNVLTNHINLTFVIIVFAVPLADTLRVMFVRIKEDRHLFVADRSHIHHILYSQKIRHKTVVMIIHLFSVMFILMAIYYAKVSRINAILIFVVLLTAFFFAKQIIEFIIRKEHLLKYGQMYKKIPASIPKLYRNFLVPLVSLVLLFVFIFLLFHEIGMNQQYYKYFILLLIPSLFYSGIRLRRNNYYAELIVLINFILFFTITGFNGFFYKLYPVPIISKININQIFIIILSGMVIFFTLFKERIANVRNQFLTGTDLTLAVLILFIYIAVQFINLPESYKISDTLLRSFLVFLFYKIIVVLKPKIHFPLYYISFLVAVIAVLKSLF
jgi:UDP-GlcNAc:undecaprenyl-phosphate GlcNAc-1-phosphate transferase